MSKYVLQGASGVLGTLELAEGVTLQAGAGAKLKDASPAAGGDRTVTMDWPTADEGIKKTMIDAGSGIVRVLVRIPDDINEGPEVGAFKSASEPDSLEGKFALVDNESDDASGEPNAGGGLSLAYRVGTKNYGDGVMGLQKGKDYWLVANVSAAPNGWFWETHRPGK